MKEMILDRADELRTREEFGTILFQPENLRQRITGVHGAARTLVERTAERRLVFFQLPYNARTAAVRPCLHVRERLFRRIERNQAVHDRTECNAGWYPPLMAQRIRHLAYHLLRRRADLGGTFLRPIRMRRTQRIECLCRRTAHARRLVRNGAYPRRTDIHADPYALLFHTAHHAAAFP